MDKLKQHFSDFGNLIVYGLLAFVFALMASEEGVGRAAARLAAFGFLIAGMYVTVYVLAAIQTRNFSANWSERISGVYFSGFVVWWISERGLSREAIWLVIPVFSGLVIFLAHLFVSSPAGQRLSAWETRVGKRLFGLFRRN